MFSSVSSLSVNRITRKTTDQIFMKLHGMFGHNPETNQLDLSDLDKRSRSLEVKRSKSFLRIILSKIVVEGRDKSKM